MMVRKRTDTAPPAAQFDFAERLLRWHRAHGRHDLPWQHPRTPYRVWLSEIMLQQTQVAVVIDYFQRFITCLPDLPALARATQDEVLALWSGLGYYTRARNLHAAARLCMERYGGQLPRDLDALMALPGIGRSTAGAILSQAWGERAPILDGNVKRVLCRLHGIDGWPGTPEVERRLWALADALLPERQLAAYTQAQMDLGATLCTRANPDCGRCPLRDVCIARASGRVAELPTPKPRRTLPQREAHMLIVRDPDGRLLLQRRPPVGVWAGLWSLPEFDSQPAAKRWLTRQVGRGHAPATPLPALLHGFSHYRLHILPWLIRVSGPPASIADNAELRWLSREQLATTGLPAPVRRLLEDHGP